MDLLVVNSSLKPSSRTDTLAGSVARASAQLGDRVDALSLRDSPMPWCDGERCFEDPRSRALSDRVRAAHAIAIITPIYNYSFNAALKNLLEITGSAWTDKTVGFACTAGGAHGYMSILSFANALMLDYRCLIVPRFVYATSEHFSGSELKDEGILRRIGELAAALSHLSERATAAAPS